MMMQASGGTVSTPGRRWDVALSFAGAQLATPGSRPGVEGAGCACFYDADRQVRLRGLSSTERPVARAS
jgi:hypothetical protein